MKNPLSLQGEEWINSRTKRSMDVAAAGALLMPALAAGELAFLGARLADGPGAIFIQERLGRGGRPFSIAKIRTMKDVELPDGSTTKAVTPFGRIVRPFAIDETPQLLNIMEGSMALVGPRPNTYERDETMRQSLSRNQYDEWLDAFSRSTPGLLSTNNIYLRQPGFPLEDMVKKAEMDIQDFKNASLAHDLSLFRLAARIGLDHLITGKSSSSLDTTEAELATAQTGVK